MANSEDNRLAIAVEYVEQDGELKISLDDDSKHLIRVDRLQMEEWDGGSTIYFPQIQQYFRVADLVAGVYGDEDWCATLLSTVKS